MTEFSYLVGYDVRSDGVRAELAHALLDLGGHRVQQSVFVATLDAAGVVDLRHTADQLINGETDRVHWYRTCGNCPGVLASKPSFSMAQPTESTPWIV